MARVCATGFTVISENGWRVFGSAEMSCPVLSARYRRIASDSNSASGLASGRRSRDSCYWDLASEARARGFRSPRCRSVRLVGEAGFFEHDADPSIRVRLAVAAGAAGMIGKSSQHQLAVNGSDGIDPVSHRYAEIAEPVFGPADVVRVRRGPPSQRLPPARSPQR